MKSKADVSDATEAFLLCEDMLVRSYKDWIDRERECMECPPSALMRQIGWVEEGRISGSS
jgi:hypothetical protein